MNLINPTVQGTAGPTYATMQNTEMSLIDVHDHTSGKGVAVPTAGININADLSFTGYGPINQYWSSLAARALPTAALHPASLLVNAAGNLFYENTSGNQIQLTSGSVPVSNGTGTDNGFFGAGGAGYAAQAKANFDKTIGQYRFADTYADFDATGTNAANLSGGSLFLTRDQSSPLRLGTSWVTADKRPQRGFAIDIPTGAIHESFLIGADPTSAGTYVTYYAFRIDPLATTSRYSWGVGINNGQDNATAPIYALQVNSETTNGSAAAYPVVRIGRNSITSGATVQSGFGPRILMTSTSNNANATTGYTQTSVGAIDAVWGTVVGTNGGINIHGATSGTITGAAGIQLMGFGGEDYIGLRGAAVSGTTLTVYGHQSPSADDTWDLGTSSLHYNQIYTKNVVSTTTLGLVGTTVAITGNETVSGTSVITGALSSASTVTGTTIIPTAGPSSGTKYQLNQSNVPYAWANCNDGSPPILTRAYNVASGVRSGTGVYVYTLNAAISADAVVLASLTENGGGSDNITARMTSTTEVTVRTFQSASPANLDHSFLIMGA